MIRLSNVLLALGALLAVAGALVPGPVEAVTVGRPVNTGKAVATPGVDAEGREEALALSQAAIGRSLGEHTLVDQTGRAFQLVEMLDKPLIVTLIYSSCSKTCPLIVEALDEAAEAARKVVGPASFRILAIGFDTREDTPERLRAFARQHGLSEREWRLASGDQRTIDRLISELGFSYFPAVGGFDHLAQTTLIAPPGIIYRQVYGESFDAPYLVEPIKDLVLGRDLTWTSFEGISNRIRLFCTIYDPATNRYRFDYSIVVGGVIGLIVLGGLGFIVVRAWINLSPGERII